MNEGTRRNVLAVIGGGALVASTLLVTFGAGPGDAVAGQGTEPNIPYVQPTQPPMTFGATATAGPAATTLSLSSVSPTAKATPLAAECNTTGMCP